MSTCMPSLLWTQVSPEPQEGSFCQEWSWRREGSWTWEWDKSGFKSQFCHLTLCHLEHILYLSRPPCFPLLNTNRKHGRVQHSAKYLIIAQYTLAMVIDVHYCCYYWFYYRLATDPSQFLCDRIVSPSGCAISGHYFWNSSIFCLTLSASWSFIVCFPNMYLACLDF